MRGDVIIAGALGEWIVDACLLRPDARTRASALHAAFDDWCRAHDYPLWSATAFGRALSDRGFGVAKDGDGRRWRRGITTHKMLWTEGTAGWSSTLRSFDQSGALGLVRVRMAASRDGENGGYAGSGRMVAHQPAVRQVIGGAG